MEVLSIRGGRALSGTLKVQGAKNSVLPLLCATLLAPGVSLLHGCPALSDVSASVDILRGLGCRVTVRGDTIAVDAAALTGCTVEEGLMRAMRSSVIFLGAILARAGEVSMSYPGGCELGPRPIDLHLDALRALGAEVETRGDRIFCKGGRLRGGTINLSLPSVGATENAMLAAVAAKGETVILNAAREPEIVQLQDFLVSMGARVRGAGSSLIAIEGGHPLHAGEITVMGDRIVAGTYLAAAAACGGDVELVGVDYRQLSTVTAVLSEAGCQVKSQGQRVRLTRSLSHPFSAVSPIRTAPYPAFPTDAQPPLMAALCTAKGTTLFIENMFSNRFRHVDELLRMGADIRTEGRVAVVTGGKGLHGAGLRAADLRGGAALAVAAVSAEGESRISALEHIRRGYADLAGDLRALGAEVRQEEL